MGEARDKLHDFPGAREAFQKFLELSSDAKATGEVRKRLEKLPAK